MLSARSQPPAAAESHDDEKPRDLDRDLATSSENEEPSTAGSTMETPRATDENNEQVAQGENTAQRKEPEAGRTRLQTWLIMFALCTGLFLAALDNTIVATAAPTIADEFSSALGYTWIGSAYMLGNASTVPSWGKFSDIWGRKPILLCAVAVFWIGSLICALSINMGMLIAARAVQGIGGGGIVVLVNICISDLFSMRNRGLYYGLLGIVWAIASATGPILGGIFTSQANWRWCFWVNLPISAAGFAILILVLKLHNPRTPFREGLAAIDWTGSLLIIGGTMMFLFGLEFGGIKFPWNSAAIICLLLFGVVTIGIFFLIEWKWAKYPVIPTRLFHRRSSVVSFAVCLTHGIVFISASYYLPLYFQGVLGASPLLSGVYVIPYSMALSLVSAAGGIHIKKTGKYLPAIVFGMFVMTLGFGLLIDFGPEANWAKIVLYQLVAGVGVGPNFQAPLISLQSSVETRDIASATAAFAFIRQLSTSMSVVIGGVVFQNEMEKQYPMLLAKLGPEIANQLSGGSAGGSVGLVAGLQGEDGTIARGAYAHSIRIMYIMYTCIAGVGLLISPFVGERKLSKEHHEHKTGLKSMQAGQEEVQAAQDDKEKQRSQV